MAVALKVTYGERGEWAVLQVAGELDLMTAPVLRQRVHDAVANGRHRLVLDVGEVVFCDSSGVGVLIASRRLIRSCQGRLRLILPAHGADVGTSRSWVPRRSPSQVEGGREAGGGQGAHVNRVLAALGVRRLFDVYPDILSATADEPTDEPTAAESTADEPADEEPSPLSA